MGCTAIVSIKTPSEIIRIRAYNTSGDSLNTHLIRESRLKQGKLSTELLAPRIGRSSSLLLQYEQGVNIPKTWYVLKDICLLLCISSDDILLAEGAINTRLIHSYRVKYKKLSTSRFTQLLGLRYNNAIKYEHPTRYPSTWNTLRNICSLLHISSDELLGIRIQKEVYKNKAFENYTELFT